MRLWRSGSRHLFRLTGSMLLLVFCRFRTLRRSSSPLDSSLLDAHCGVLGLTLRFFCTRDTDKLCPELSVLVVDETVRVLAAGVRLKRFVGGAGFRWPDGAEAEADWLAGLTG